MTESATAIMAALAQIVGLPKSVIARITGHVRAGGMGIVGACDMAVADGGASFAFSEARVGVAPAIISLTTLDLMAPRAAARYYLTGETFGAAEAAELGLITLAAPYREIDTVLDGLLTQIRQTSPQASAETKKILNEGRRKRIADEAATMVATSARMFGSPDAQEGIHAFLARRAPRCRRPRVSRSAAGVRFRSGRRD